MKSVMKLIWLLVAIVCSTSCYPNNGLGECSTFCLPTSTGFTCACEDGVELLSDGQTCSNKQRHLTTTTSLPSTPSTKDTTVSPSWDDNTPEPQKNNLSIPVGAGAGGFILILAIIILIVVLVRRRSDKQKQSGNSNNQQELFQMNNPMNDPDSRRIFLAGSDEVNLP